jgi:uncharacterized membrane protein YjjP (DUF1212 family)
MKTNSKVDELLRTERKYTMPFQYLAFACLLTTFTMVFVAIWGNWQIAARIGISTFVAFYILMKVARAITNHFFERAANELEKMNGIRNPNVKQTNPLNN